MYKIDCMYSYVIGGHIPFFCNPPSKMNWVLVHIAHTPIHILEIINAPSEMYDNYNVHNEYFQRVA